MTDAVGSPPRATLAGSWQVLRRDRTLWAALIASLVGGVANSITAPQLSLYLTEELGASLRQAGWFYLTNLTAPIAGLLVGASSDRSRRPWLWYRISGIVTALGWFVVAASNHLWVPFAASTILLAFGGAAGGQLFTGVRHRLTTLEQDPTEPIAPDTSTQVMALIRMAMTAGWIIGPVVGSWLGGVVGLRAVIVASGIGLLIQVAVMFRERDPEPVVRGVLAEIDTADPSSPDRGTTAPGTTDPGTADSIPGRAGARRTSLMPMVVFTALCVITLAGNTMKYAYLPIYLVDHFHTSDTVRGAVIGSQQVVELTLMPVSAVLAARFGALRVVAGGALAAVLAHLSFVLGPSLAWMFIGQVLLGVMWSAIAALGLPVAMELAGARVGVASGLFMSSGPVAAAIGGFLGGAAVPLLGLPGVFWVPVALSAAALSGLLIMDAQRRRAANLDAAART